LTASFFGVSGFAASDSAAVAVTVSPAATTLTLRSSVNPAVTGQAVTFTATVAAVAPAAGSTTGTVTFMDGNVVLGTVQVAPHPRPPTCGGAPPHRRFQRRPDIRGQLAGPHRAGERGPRPQGDDTGPVVVRQPGRGGAGGHVHGHGPRPIGNRHADGLRHVL